VAMGKQKEEAIGKSMANATLCYQEEEERRKN
jgi:hypothetical protein